MPSVYSLDLLPRIAILTLVYLGVVGLALNTTGCQPALPGQPAPENPAKTSLSSPQITLTLATWGSQEEIAQLNNQLELFHQQHPTITVQLRHIPENYLQKLHILAAAHLLPDVFLINSWHLPMFAQHQLVADINRLIPKKQLQEQFYPTALQALSYNHSYLGALPRDISNVVMYVNTDVLDAYGLPTPSRHWTMAEFEQLAQSICQKNLTHSERNRTYAVSFYRQPPLFWLPWLWSNGGELLTTNNQWAIQQPKSRKALAQYLNFHSGECPIAPLKTQMGQANPTQWFLQQRLVFLASGRWVTPLFRQQANFKWDVWPMPAGSQGSITGVDATGYAMARQTAHPKASLALIQFLTRPQAIAEFSRSGLVVPARPDVATSSAFLAPSLPPQHGKVFLETLANGHPTPHHPQWGTLEEALTQALSPYWDTTLPVTDNQLKHALTPLAPQQPLP